MNLELLDATGFLQLMQQLMICIMSKMLWYLLLIGLKT